MNSIYIPPLRDRKEDIPELVRLFIRQSTWNQNIKPEILYPPDMSLFLKYDWPGNVRELKGYVERSLMQILFQGCPWHAVLSPGEDLLERGYAFKKTLAEVERSYIKRVLGKTGWNIEDASRILDIHRHSLSQKIKQYNIKRLKPVSLPSLRDYLRKHVSKVYAQANSFTKTARILRIARKTVGRFLQEA